MVCPADTNVESILILNSTSIKPSKLWLISEEDDEEDKEESVKEPVQDPNPNQRVTRSKTNNLPPPINRFAQNT